MNKKRFAYTLSSLILFVLIIFIALFVRDRFIRPYGGDILVTALICSVIRIIIPAKGIIKHDFVLPFCVFLFALAVEIGQYFGLVSLLGLDEIPLFRIALGTVFSPEDIACYAVGCAVFALFEHILLRCSKRK